MIIANQSRLRRVGQVGHGPPNHFLSLKIITWSVEALATTTIAMAIADIANIKSSVIRQIGL